MSTLMMALKQPISIPAWAARLGWASASKRSAPVARRRKPRRAAPPPGPLLAEQADAEAAAACGWFDSSHELHQGLVVLEHSSADGLGHALPVTVWLDLVLQAAPAGAQFAADTALEMTPGTAPADRDGPAQGMMAS